MAGPRLLGIRRGHDPSLSIRTRHLARPHGSRSAIGRPHHPGRRRAPAARAGRGHQAGPGHASDDGGVMKQCLIALLRQHFLRDGVDSPLFTALQHPRLARAVAAILDRPADPHSVGSLDADVSYVWLLRNAGPGPRTAGRFRRRHRPQDAVLQRNEGRAAEPRRSRVTRCPVHQRTRRPPGLTAQLAWPAAHDHRAGRERSVAPGRRDAGAKAGGSGWAGRATAVSGRHAQGLRHGTRDG